MTSGGGGRWREGEGKRERERVGIEDDTQWLELQAHNQLNGL
jgi:hypothetical protein